MDACTDPRADPHFAQGRHDAFTTKVSSFFFSLSAGEVVTKTANSASLALCQWALLLGAPDTLSHVP